MSEWKESTSSIPDQDTLVHARATLRRVCSDAPIGLYVISDAVERVEPRYWDIFTDTVKHNVATILVARVQSEAVANLGGDFQVERIDGKVVVFQRAPKSEYV